MLEWYFVVFFMGANVPDTNLPEILTRTFSYTTEKECIRGRVEELDKLVTDYVGDGGIITACSKRTKVTTEINPLLKGGNVPL